MPSQAAEACVKDIQKELKRIGAGKNEPRMGLKMQFKNSKDLKDLVEDLGNGISRNVVHISLEDVEYSVTNKGWYVAVSGMATPLAEEVKKLLDQKRIEYMAGGGSLWVFPDRDTLKSARKQLGK